MRTVVLRAQADRRHPLIHEPCILPRAEMPGWIAAAGKDKIIERFHPPFEPGEQARARGLHDLELNRLAVFCWTMIARGFTEPPLTTSPILSFTRSQPRSLLSMARSSKARSLSRFSWSRKKPDRPDLLHLEGAFRSHEAACIPGSAVIVSRVKAGSSMTLLCWPLSDDDTAPGI